HRSTVSAHFHLLFFLYTDAALTEIYTLSLHDALPIFLEYLKGTSGSNIKFTYAEAFGGGSGFYEMVSLRAPSKIFKLADKDGRRSEEHTSELQSRENLVCRLLLEKKKIKQKTKCDLII